MTEAASANSLMLGAGKLRPRWSEPMGRKRMQELIASLEEWADWVMPDTPSPLGVADDASVARWADGVVLVTKGGGSRRPRGGGAGAEGANREVYILAILVLMVYFLDQALGWGNRGRGRDTVVSRVLVVRLPRTDDSSGSCAECV